MKRGRREETKNNLYEMTENADPTENRTSNVDKYFFFWHGFSFEEMEESAYQ